MREEESVTECANVRLERRNGGEQDPDNKSHSSTLYTCSWRQAGGQDM